MWIKLLSFLTALLITLNCWADIDLTNATNDYGTTPTGVHSGAGNISYGFWFKSSQAGNNRHIMNIGAVSDDNMSHVMLHGGKIKFGAWGNDATSTNTYNDGNWHQVTIVYDGSGYTCYVDGDQDGTSTYSALNVTDLAVHIGSYRGDPTDGTYQYVGDLTEIFIYGTDLSQQEVRQISESRIKHVPLQIQPSSLEMFQPCDDGQDDSAANTETARDISGNGKDITWTNGTWQASEILSYP